MKDASGTCRGLRRLALSIGWSCVAAAKLHAGEVWTLHGFDYGLIRTKRIEVDLHARFRTSQHMRNVQQGRSGALVRWNAHRRITPLGGYCFGQQEDEVDEQSRFHRLFGGAEVPAFGGKTARLASRTLVEGFVAAPGQDFNRYRQRLRLSGGGKIGPYLSTEWFFDAKGYLSARHGGAVRWRCGRSAWIEMGYLYDDRSPKLGPERHMLVTQLFFGRPRR